ncbi:helix-turn-helix domain-containing protein [Ornithobacterium rhinotracheale]|uniref:Plasmid maintenance system antidote protein n=1 Tax=Ornithobacterium rhinotracheale (strain ATCC 51463 / DSM 15997 / CCUG 23171 / CIP 104009 / LMG 9086) TaxID=867902 RepID=I4A2H0_ORNRL|nr:helix-turn-helix domain-containing protein [Ornithobacterium rhinotracheale]AFL98154.1 plasmid maintenance system antidote protein [Ornithobacterium rhinotracheale DSM 15997]AIP99908.1 DNA-binding protein [Ornithobacterium rhinotracheale ORT-UMN 88]KGB66345.1 hypothetical protein Q787_09800 [Ornithobacterium rhinotracheale H06-030791]MBN3661776.1 helix-turn-helix transcriptional regulator [Ornithobacterium rhinotracheale]MCK0193545.1 helix-turn-helix domain-containing protein [Ornithobacter
MANKEKFIELVSDTVSDTVERAKLRKARRRQLRLSQKIALNILKRIEELGWKQKDLAEKMGVSPQQVSKWVKGKENFTIETIATISDVLDIELIQVKPLSERKIELKNYKEMKDVYEENTTKIIHLSPDFGKKITQSKSYSNPYLKMANY